MKNRVLIAVVAILVAAPVVADLLQESEMATGWTALPVNGSVRLVHPGGAVRSVRAPAGGRVADVASVGDGWTLAGSRAESSGGQLFLLSDVGGVVREIGAPAVTPGVLTDAPSLLIEGGEIAGMAWLEGSGPRSLAVRLASLDGGIWSGARTVAPPAPGSQLALRSAVLGDGRWLLVWSAYDGTDDEILWTVGRPNGAWTPPSRIAGDNTVPDITPSLVATPEGAAVAWSRFGSDGEYRVVLSRYDGSTWGDPVEISGPGGVRPALHRAEGTLILYRTVEPDAWALTEIDPAGRPTRTATVPTDRADRPRLVAVDGEGAELAWSQGVGFVSRRASFAAER